MIIKNPPRQLDHIQILFVILVKNYKILLSFNSYKAYYYTKLIQKVNIYKKRLIKNQLRQLDHIQILFVFV